MYQCLPSSVSGTENAPMRSWPTIGDNAQNRTKTGVTPHARCNPRFFVLEGTWPTPRRLSRACRRRSSKKRSHARSVQQNRKTLKRRFPITYHPICRTRQNRSKRSVGLVIRVLAPLFVSSSAGRKPQVAPTAYIPADFAVIISVAVSPR